MSQENLTIVQVIHAALTRGESPASLGLLHPDIEYVNPPGAVEPGTRRGVAAYEDAIRSINEAFGDVGIEVREMRDVGDQVVVLATFIARGRSSGVQRESEGRVRMDRSEWIGCRLPWFNDPVKALEAVGLRE